MAGRIPQSFIDELMTRVDIVDVIDAQVPLRKGGRDHVACCPFHEEKTPSFTVSREKQFYHCFGCGAHGTALGFLMEYGRLDFIDAVHELADQFGLKVPGYATEQGSASAVSGRELYGTLADAAAFYRRQLCEHPAANRATNYLNGRGLTSDIIAQFAIGFAPAGWDNLLRSLGTSATRRVQLEQAGLLKKKADGSYCDRFRERVMFPIHDQRGRVIGFGGRVIGDDSPKYLNSPETPLFHKGSEVYGLYEVRKAGRSPDRLLVVEGYMDVVALAQHGVSYAAAPMGTAITQGQLERLFRAAPHLIFSFDGDRAGRDAAWRALENVIPLLHEMRQASFLFLPDGEDPDTMVRAEGGTQFEQRVAGATAFSTFFFDTLLKTVDIGVMDGRARLVELARPLLSKLPTSVFREMMVMRLAELVRMNFQAVVRALASTENGPNILARSMPVAQRKVIRQPKSMMRRAITHILQNPGLAASVGDCDRFSGMKIPGLNIMLELLEMVKEQPQLNTAALLERWRGHAQEMHLFALAQTQYLVAEEATETEFRKVLDLLYREGLRQRETSLIEKARVTELTPDEQLEMKEVQRLLRTVGAKAH